MMKKIFTKLKAATVIPAETRRYDLQQLVKEITPENKHQLVDWGKPIGEEIW